MKDKEKRNVILESVRFGMEFDISQTKDSILQITEHLVDKLVKLQEGLKSEDPNNWSFNSIGVLQGNGPELDGLCQKLAAEMKALDRLSRLEEE